MRRRGWPAREEFRDVEEAARDQWPITSQPLSGGWSTVQRTGLDFPITATDTLPPSALQSQASDFWLPAFGQTEWNTTLSTLPGYPAWGQLPVQVPLFEQQGTEGVPGSTYDPNSPLLHSAPQPLLQSTPLSLLSDVQQLRGPGPAFSADPPSHTSAAGHCFGGSPIWHTSGELSDSPARQHESDQAYPLLHTLSAPVILESAGSREALPVVRPIVQTGMEMARNQSAPANAGGRRIARTAEERKQHRMAKNRATAAASRKRKQAAKADLLVRQKTLEEENQELRRRLARVDEEIAETREQLDGAAVSVGDFPHQTESRR